MGVPGPIRALRDRIGAQDLGSREGWRGLGRSGPIARNIFQAATLEGGIPRRAGGIVGQDIKAFQAKPCRTYPVEGYDAELPRPARPTATIFHVAPGAQAVVE